MTGDELRRRRESLGFTRVQLARRLGVRAATLARWERATEALPNSAMLTLALQALGAEPVEVTEGLTVSRDPFADAPYFVWKPARPPPANEPSPADSRPWWQRLFVVRRSRPRRGLHLGSSPPPVPAASAPPAPPPAAEPEPVYYCRHCDAPVTLDDLERDSDLIAWECCPTCVADERGDDPDDESALS